MYAFIVVILFLAFGLLLLFGLLHVARELITRPSPHMFSYSDFDADQNNDLPGATESSSPQANPISCGYPHPSCGYFLQEFSRRGSVACQSRVYAGWR